ncbi:MAG: biopolymer transporter ExbD, partial [Myxococcota bacterium]
MHVGGGKGARAEINVTPLVDVVLVLLIIFMVLTPLVLREMKLAVPRKAEVSLPLEVAAQQVVLRYGRDRRVLVNDEAVPLAELEQRLRAVYAARRDKVIFFDVEDDANYGESVRVMDVAKAAGVETIG